MPPTFQYTSKQEHSTELIKTLQRRNSDRNPMVGWIVEQHREPWTMSFRSPFPGLPMHENSVVRQQ